MLATCNTSSGTEGASLGIIDTTLRRLPSNASAASSSLIGGATGLGAAAARSRQARTLDMEHGSELQRLSTHRRAAEDLHRELGAVAARVRALEAREKRTLTGGECDELKVCADRAVALRRQLQHAASSGDAVDYYLRTAPILFKYYDLVDKGGAAATAPVTSHVTAASTAVAPAAAAAALSPPLAPTGAPSILAYFMQQQPQKLDAPAAVGRGKDKCDGGADAAAKDGRGEGKPQGGGGDVVLLSGIGLPDDRAALLDKYLNVLESPLGSAALGTRTAPTAASASATSLAATALGPTGGGGGGSSRGGSSWDLCPHCQGASARTLVLHDGYVYCPTCHTIEYVLVDHDKPAYKEPPKEIAYFAYKRINHFNEWLNQSQGKETTEIPEDVYDNILLEIKKQKIQNMASLTPQRIKGILKKLRLNKFYEHSAHIISRLNGLPSPHLPPELEDRLRSLFCATQQPFLRHAPSTRKNFLSYSYCLHKMLQLLGEDQYLASFPLLRSREKLNQQDRIWEKICAEVGWEFIPSL